MDVIAPLQGARVPAVSLQAQESREVAAELLHGGFWFALLHKDTADPVMAGGVEQRLVWLPRSDRFNCAPKALDGFFWFAGGL
jgi:hypothetical protein